MPAQVFTIPLCNSEANHDARHGTVIGTAATTARLLKLIPEHVERHTDDPLYDPDERDRRLIARLVLLHKRPQLRKNFSEVRHLDALAPHVAYPSQYAGVGRRVPDRPGLDPR